MTYFDVILLGIVQGLTEFLPISSSGHLLLAHHFLGKTVDNLSFDVALHVGTLLSLTVFYFARWRKFGFSGISLSHLSWQKTVSLVVIACVPTAIMGLFFRHDIERMSEGSEYLAGGFLINAILLFFTYWYYQRSSNQKVLNPIRAFFIGVAQGIAIVPAISRSCTTISAGLLSGISRVDAVLFSFLISMPAIFGACLLEVPKIDWHSTSFSLVGLGILSSFLSGLIGIAGVKKLVGDGKLHYFAWYLVVVGFGTYWHFGQW